MQAIGKKTVFYNLREYVRHFPVRQPVEHNNTYMDGGGMELILRFGYPFTLIRLNFSLDILFNQLQNKQTRK